MVESWGRFTIVVVESVCHCHVAIIIMWLFANTVTLSQDNFCLMPQSSHCCCCHCHRRHTAVAVIACKVAVASGHCGHLRHCHWSGLWLWVLVHEVAYTGGGHRQQCRGMMALHVDFLTSNVGIFVMRSSGRVTPVVKGLSLVSEASTVAS